MKKIAILILLTILLSSFASINESEENLITETMIDYIALWKVKIDNKYNNNDFLNEINMTEQTYELWGDTIMKGIHGGLYIQDSFLIVEGLKFDFLTLKTKLKKTHKRRLEKKIRYKNTGEGTIRFSYPILSFDGNNAIVYLNSFTSPLAASIELFLLEKTKGKWLVKDRILKQIS
jgi:hypothetical protein